MAYLEPELRSYSDCGMRTVEAWKSFGRVVPEGVEPRVRAKARSIEVSLYTRDQTQPAPASTRVKR